MNEQIILGTPFLTQIYPFKVTNIGIYPLKFNKMCFEFSFFPIAKDIKVIQENEIFSINMLRRKENFIYDLQNEVYYMRIEQKLKTPQVQQKIEEFKKLFEKEVCVEIPNAFLE